LWFWDFQIVKNLGFLDFDIISSLATSFKLGFFVMLIMVVFASFGSYMLKKNLQVQKNLSILYWALFFALLPVLFQANIRLDPLIIFVAPMSIFLSFNLSNMRPPLAEALHFILLVGILVIQLSYFWL
jgi:hypothetical protein